MATLRDQYKEALKQRLAPKIKPVTPTPTATKTPSEPLSPYAPYKLGQSPQEKFIALAKKNQDKVTVAMGGKTLIGNNTNTATIPSVLSAPSKTPGITVNTPSSTLTPSQQMMQTELRKPVDSRDMLRQNAIEAKRQPLPTNYKEPGFLGQIGDSLIQGTYSTISAIGSSLEAADQPTRQGGMPTGFGVVGKHLTDYAKGQLLAHPEWQRPQEMFDRSFLQNMQDPNYYARIVFENIPNMVGAMAATMTGGAAGGFVAGAILEGGAEFQQAKDAGLSDTEASRLAGVVGTVNGVLNSVTPLSILGESSKPVAKVASKGITSALINLVKHVGFHAAEEALTEAAQQTISDYAVQSTLQNKGKAYDPGLQGAIERFQNEINNVSAVIYDKNKKQINVGILESALSGFITGGLASGVEQVTSSLFNAKQVPVEPIINEIPSNEPPPPPGGSGGTVPEGRRPLVEGEGSLRDQMNAEIATPLTAVVTPVEGTPANIQSAELTSTINQAVPGQLNAPVVGAVFSSGGQNVITTKVVGTDIVGYTLPKVETNQLVPAGSITQVSIPIPSLSPTNMTVDDIQTTVSKIHDLIAMDQQMRATTPKSLPKSSNFITSTQAEGRVRLYFSPQELQIAFKQEIRTPEGTQALGRYANGVIEMINNPHVTTPEHEVVHAFLDKFIEPEQKSAILEEVKAQAPAELSDLTAEEKLADMFATYVKEHKGVVGKLKELFDKIIDSIRKYVTHAPVSEIKQLFRNIRDKKRPTEPPKQRALQMEAMYQRGESLSTKFLELEDIKGREFASKQFLFDSLKSGKANLKQIEKDLIAKVINEQFANEKNINIKELSAAVNSELLPLDIVYSDQYSNYGHDHLDNMGFTMVDAKTHIYSSPINHGKRGHFNVYSLFGHARAWDADNNNDIRYIAEIQSDVFQHDLESLSPVGVQAEDANKELTEALLSDSAKGAAVITPKVLKSFTDKYGKDVMIPLIEGKIGALFESISYAKERIEREKGSVADAEKELKDKLAASPDATTTEAVHSIYDRRVERAKEDLREYEARLLASQNQDIVLNKIRHALTLETTPLGEDFLSKTQEKEFRGIVHGVHSDYYLGDGNKLKKIVRGVDNSEEEISDFPSLDKKTLKPLVEKVKAEINAEITATNRDIADRKNSEDYKAEQLPGVEGYKVETETIKRDEWRIEKNLRRIEIADKVYELASNEDPKELIANYMKMWTAFASYKNTWFERIIREELHQAAQDGKKELLFPTPYTASVIEGFVGDGNGTGDDSYSQGDDVEHMGETWTILDSSGDGNYEAAPARNVITFTSDEAYDDERDSHAQDIQYELKNNPEALTLAQEGKYAEAIKADKSGDLEPFFNWVERKKEDAPFSAIMRQANGDIKDLAYDFAEDYYMQDFDAVQNAQDMHGNSHVFTREHMNSVTIYAVAEGDAESIVLYENGGDGTIDPSAFNYETDLGNTDHQTVARFYDKQVGRYLAKLRGKNLETYTDESGSTWLKTAITENDRAAVHAYQRLDDIPEADRGAFLEHGAVADFESQGFADHQVADYEALAQQVLDQNMTPAKKETLKQRIKNATMPKVNKIAMSEMALLKKRLRDEANGFKTGRIVTRQALLDEIRQNNENKAAVLASLVSYITSNVEKEQRGKFLSAVQSISSKGRLTEKNIRSIFDSVEQRAEKIEKSSAIIDLKENVKAALKNKSLPVDYQRQVKAFLEGYDMSRPTMDTLIRLHGLANYLTQQGSEATNIPAERIRELKRLTQKPLADMTTEDIKALNENLGRIMALGKLKAQMKNLYDQRVHDRNLTALLDSTVNVDPAIANPNDKTEAEKLSIGSRSLFLSTMPFAYTADTADGLQMHEGQNSYWYKQIRLASNKAELQADALTLAVLNEAQALEGADANGVQQKIALNLYANQPNTQTQVKFLLEKLGLTEVPVLTEAEQKVADSMVAAFDAIANDVATVSEELTNVPFEKVPNYFPLKYVGEIPSHDAVQEVMKTFARKTKVEGGFTKGRVNNVEHELRTDIFQVFLDSIGQHTYYVNVQPVLTDVASLVKSGAYKAKAGNVLSEAWTNYLDTVARRGQAAGSKTSLDFLIKKGRLNMSKAILGFKLSTILMQPLAIFQAMSYVTQKYGTATSLSLLGEFTKSWLKPGYVKNILKESPALELRQGGDATLKEIKESLGSFINPETTYEKFLNKINKAAFSLIQKTDISTAAGVTEAVYKHLRDAGLSDADARAEGDFVMDLVSGSGSVVDRPLILSQGELMRSFFTFQTFALASWGNVMHNIVRGGLLKKGNGFQAKATAGLSMIMVVGGMMAENLVRLAMYNALHSKKEDKKMESTIWATFASIVGLIPLFGQMIDGAMSGFGSELSNPVFSTLSSAISGVTSAVKGNKPETRLKGVEKAAEATATLAGVPGTAQAFDLLDALILK